MLAKAGASCLDLTGVTHDPYGEVQKLVKVPVLGGQAGADSFLLRNEATVVARPKDVGLEVGRSLRRGVS